ncbi:MAG: hypothetical protein NVSMB26_27140 [Beijerinckiaceae bacterium]
MTTLAHGPRVAITKRLDALEGLAKRFGPGAANARAVEVYAQARVLIRDLEDLFAEHLPTRIHIGPQVQSIRQRLAAMADLEEHEIPDEKRGHLGVILDAIQMLRKFLPPEG